MVKDCVPTSLRSFQRRVASLLICHNLRCKKCSLAYDEIIGIAKMKLEDGFLFTETDYKEMVLDALECNEIKCTDTETALDEISSLLRGL